MYWQKRHPASAFSFTISHASRRLAKDMASWRAGVSIPSRMAPSAAMALPRVMASWSMAFAAARFSVKGWKSQL